MNTWSDGQIITTVAAGATTGNAMVLQNGVMSNAVPFTVNLPHITNVSPNSGASGTAITISGSGFGATQGSGNVWIGSTYGLVMGWSDTQVVAAVASNAVSGIVKVQQNGIWSNTLTFTVPTSLGGGGGASVTLVPNVINMVVGGTQTIQAVNSSGQSVTGLTWASSNPAVATLSADDPPIITAAGPGNTTITAGNASADVTVWTGPALPTGTVIWSNPGDGSGVSSIIPAVPSSTGVADVFAMNASGNVQAITANGTTAWTASIGTNNSTVPDFQGGLVVTNGSAIYRLDGMTGTQSSWTYQPASGQLSTPVVHTDGTIFTVSTPTPNSDGTITGPITLVGIDPSSGQPKASPAMENTTVETPNGGGNNECCKSPFCCLSSPLPQSGGGDSTSTYPPTVGNLIIAGDGYAYVPYLYYNSTPAVTTYHLRILRVGTDGSAVEINLGDWDNTSSDSSQPSLPILITNADQGVLASYQLNVTTSDTGTVSDFYLATTSGASVTSNTQVALVAEQSAPVQPVLQRADGSYIGTISSSAGNQMIAFTSSGSTLWLGPNDPPQIATSGGGVIGASGTTYDQNGNVTGQIAKMPIQSWTDYDYQLLGSVEQLDEEPVDQDLSYGSQVAGNNSHNNTAKKQPGAKLILRFGGNLKVSPHDPFINTNAIYYFGETLLGMQSGNFQGQAVNGCYAGYELVATVTPSNFTGPVTIKRYVNSEACWIGSSPQFNIPGLDSCHKSFPPVDDTGNWFSTNPSKDPNGQVFNLDHPGYWPFTGVSNPPYRQRVNFETYVVDPDGDQISTKINFYTRLSCQTNSNGVALFSQDVVGDNTLGTGTTPTTPDLK